MLTKYTEHAYALLRIVSGVLFACHGAQKLFGVLGGTRMTGDPLMLVAGLIEFFGGLLIALGLGTRVAAFIASGQMAVAYFKAHAPQAFWPIQNHGEMAMLYCFLFLFFSTRGTGRFGIDSVFRKSRL
jgi:putative oxidoreductase